MPVVSCPKCPTKLKIPDGVSGNTKCPKCGTVFPVGAAAAPAPAFEVVDDAPPPTPKPAAPKPAPKPAAKAAAMEPDFEVVEETPKKKKQSSRDEDDEDEDDVVIDVYDENGKLIETMRPRSKKRRRDDDDDEDDEDDDEPKTRKKKGDKKSKKKKKRYFDDEDDDDDWQPQRGGGGGAFAKGKTGALLLSISFWLNLGAFGLLTLYTLIAWIGINGSSSSSSSSSPRSSSSGDGDGSFLDVIVILPGLIGLGAWIVGTIGCSFAIAGPRKARGMAITATVFAGVHLLLTAVTFSNLQDGIGIGRGVPGLGKIAWIVVASTLPTLDTFLPVLFYQSKEIGGDYVIALLAAICEVGRLIFALLTLKAMAVAAKNYEVAERAQMDVTVVSLVVGGVALFTLFVAILLREGGFKSMSTYANLGLGTVFLMYLAYTFMMLLPALVAMDTKHACARRS